MKVILTLGIVLGLLVNFAHGEVTMASRLSL